MLGYVIAAAVAALAVGALLWQRSRATARARQAAYEQAADRERRARTDAQAGLDAVVVDGDHVIADQDREAREAVRAEVERRGLGDRLRDRNRLRRR